MNKIRTLNNQIKFKTKVAINIIFYLIATLMLLNLVVCVYVYEEYRLIDYRIQNRCTLIAILGTCFGVSTLIAIRVFFDAGFIKYSEIASENKQLKKKVKSLESKNTELNKIVEKQDKILIGLNTEE